MSVCVGNEVIEWWIMGNDIHCLLWQSLADGESYVRATVITAFISLRTTGSLWHDFTHRHVAEVC